MKESLMQNDSLSILMMIPEVSLLFIYKENYDKSFVMRKVIAEILRTGYYIKIEAEGRTRNIAKHNYSMYSDCAFISISVNGIGFLPEQPENINELFASQLEQQKNVLHYESTIVNVEKNVSCIEIAIRITEASPAQQATSSGDKIQAA